MSINKKCVLTVTIFVNVFLFKIEFARADENIINTQVTSEPDMLANPPEIIRSHGYPIEVHTIQSEDGYLQEFHRIPHGKSGKPAKYPYPVLLHHGIFCTSLIWIINGPEKSLGYVLADEGYDVWLVNARGNTHSRRHISLSPEQTEFWNFSFHEMGKYDLPAAIDYILKVTNGRKVIHIGHSLGATTFYAFSATRPEYNHKILIHIGMAPIGMLSRTTSTFRILIPFIEQFKSMSGGAFLENDLPSALFKNLFCVASLFDLLNSCEELIIYNLFGKDDEQLDKSLLPLLMKSMPAGTSPRNVIHSLQLITSGNFSQYDYGLEENILKYNSTIPPAYNLSNIDAPVRFYYGKNDILANVTDVELLYSKLPQSMGCIMIPFEKWNHVDFVLGIDVNRLFNKDLILFLRNLTETNEIVSNNRGNTPTSFYLAISSITLLINLL